MWRPLARMGDIEGEVGMTRSRDGSGASFLDQLGAVVLRSDGLGLPEGDLC